MPPKRTVKSVVLAGVLGLGIAIAIGVAGFSKGALPDQGGETEARPMYPLFILASIYLSLLVGIVVHELGHLAAGVCAGFRVNFLRIGPLQINPPFRLSLQLKSGLPAAGVVSVLPKKRDRLPGRAAIMIFGGPCANLISALVVLLLPKPLSLLGVSFVAISLLLGVSNLVPFARKGLVSDGNRILMVLRNTQRGQRWLAIQQLFSDWWAGTSPENFDSELLQRATALQDELLDASAGYLLAYAAAFSGHRDADAKALLETALAHSSWSARGAKEGLLTEAAIFQARRGGRVDLAEQWLSEIPRQTQMPGLRAQAEAAVLEGKNDKTAALAKLNESAAAISQTPAGAQRDIMLRSIERWKGELTDGAAEVSLSG